MPFSAPHAKTNTPVNLLKRKMLCRRLMMTNSDREHLVDLCRRYCVRRLEAFGSTLRPDFDPQKSDVDLLVEFEPLAPGKYADTYFDLLEALEQLFGRQVDLVVAAAIRNPYFRESVEREKALLYAA